MKIAVCIKQVPTVSKIEFDYQSKTIIREGVPLEMNVFDLIALGRAVELKEELGAEVTVVTMGPPQAKDALAHALAVGADHAVLITDRLMAGSDTLATSRTLSLFLKDKGYDLILCGRNSTDAETGQVGPEVAELLDIPHISRARKLDYRPNSNSIVVERVTDDGYEVMESSLPALVTASEGLSEERWPRRQAIAEARERPMEEVTAAHLSSETAIFGADGSPTSVADIRLLEPQRLARVIEEPDPREAAKQVAEGIKYRPAATSAPSNR
ncbi:MAG: electron transfer flavoprotein subunit beta/FixA family protein, partial [Chloroflexi bacterium]|nr:electron transfer flavoprotein subunit beta/FixA family protein [Chloroflexota bacterium]